MKSKLDKHRKEIRRMAKNGWHYPVMAVYFVVNSDTMRKYMKAHRIKYFKKSRGGARR